MQPTTCQLCGREIKAAKGLIAHHGYLRPGHGWQTQSCFGAKRLPYEHPQGYDAILDGIEQNKRHIQHMRTLAAKHLAGEGEVLDYLAARRDSGWVPLDRYYAVMRPHLSAEGRAKRVAEVMKHEAYYRTTYARHLNTLADEVAAALPSMQARYTNHPTIKAGTL